MADDISRSPRRRPVDMLFGEEVQLKPNVPEAEPKPAAPGYMVEPPRPVTAVRPPPPEYPNDWRVNTPPEPAALPDIPIELMLQTDPVAPPPRPPVVETVAPEPVAEAVTFTPPPPSESKRQPLTAPVPPPIFVMPQAQQATSPQPAPAPAVVPAAAPAPAPLYGQTELLELSQFVDQLYQNVADETSDSAALNADCLGNLNAARSFIEKGEYAKAEAAAEQVKARLLRARASRAAASAQGTRILMVGLAAATIGGVVLFVIPFLFRFVPVIEPLISATGLGLVGGSIAALFQLSRGIARRELDPGNLSKYALSPLFGALVGAVMYLLSVLGILAAPNALGMTFEPFALMYLFALLGGFFNDAILGAIRGLAPKRQPAG